MGGQLVINPTHHNAIFDLVITNDKLSILNLEVTSPFSTSDHASLSWQTWFPINVPPPSVSDPTYNFAKADYEMLDTYFLKIDNAKFKNKVVPGDTLLLKLELMAPIRRGICQMLGTAYVGNKIVSEAELTAQIVKRSNNE